ncbi:hypothetical protein A5630_15460 [Mycolicibacterium mucogenicum]|uniref:Tetratricopeptide repeat protein n=1 Tax=Mycolicibacterium mucogenicum TaxID=56689 RepID=A0A1A3HAV4_MYCMU|nr:hypothetical protein [Mycolicibacterium mucogenicum]OBJ44804.1 hypothetical protein A5630_15460 [Mycolicibacterium mucogenicum]
MSRHPYNLGKYRRKVLTSSPQAQTWFDFGLGWTYGFNPEEAVRCFQRAAELDPNFAMAYWGIAYASGPNYNKAWTRFDQADLVSTVSLAQAALERAFQITGGATLVEQALISALRVRFPTGEVSQQQAPDFHVLNCAYAEAMRGVYLNYSTDLDVAALFADALLCVRPRALWDVDSGEPTGYGTIEARKVLEDAMAQPHADDHPALPHLYVHLMEMSPFPEIASGAADRLRRLAPDASHLAHMATHIDAARGDWARVIDSNNDAIAADENYFARESGSPVGWYDLYRAHNLNAKAYGSMMAGRLQEAMRSAARLNHLITPELLRVASPPMADWAEAYLTVLPHVLVRFGRWIEILQLQLPADQLLFCSTTAMTWYARGIACAALGSLSEAEAARSNFAVARETVPPSRMASIPVLEMDVLAVAAAMLDGEIYYRRGRFEEAFASLRRAIELEDALPYADPPAWLQPVRHAYGALLTEQGRLDEAVATYRADLGLDGSLARRRTRPNNVWSLQGLHECLTRLGRHNEVAQIAAERDTAMTFADVHIGVSCYCRQSAFPESHQIRPKNGPSGA